MQAARLREQKTTSLARRLYRAMPGAPPVPDDGANRTLWGEVERTEHYHFCSIIANEIVAANARVFVDRD